MKIDELDDRARYIIIKKGDKLISGMGHFIIKEGTFQIIVKSPFERICGRKNSSWEAGDSIDLNYVINDIRHYIPRLPDVLFALVVRDGLVEVRVCAKEESSRIWA